MARTHYVLGGWLLVPFFSFSIAWAQLPDLSPLPGTGKLKSSSTDQFTFVLAGDNRPAHKSCPQPSTTGKIFSAVKDMSPAAAFVLWTGDTISGKNPDEQTLDKQYKEFLDIAATAGVPVFNAPGNHEMDDQNDQPSKDMKGYYKKYMAETYGVFSYGNSRFIALDSENNPDGSNASSANNGKAPGAITQKQLDLLDADLSAAEKAKVTHVFIFMHHPVKPYKSADGLDPDNAKALKKILNKHQDIVSYVVSGHEHMYYNPQSKTGFDPPPSRKDPSSDKPYYLVSGGAGAPLKGVPDKPTPGSFNHYLVFTVDGAKVTPSLVKVTPDPCTGGKCCTPQGDMQ
ncbi:MAG TPA: metallophosphoesterase [Candidatus Eisenbacteria bacterium]|nr:metallophosphoesterase [Candidatus Eisenbacteria bacterium]